MEIASCNILYNFTLIITNLGKSLKKQAEKKDK